MDHDVHSSPSDAAPSGGLHIHHAHDDRTVDRKQLGKLVRYVLDAENVDLQYLGVILADHETVLELNRSFLEHDYVTDVLSFPLEAPEADSSSVNGEIYVDLDTAAERAPEFSTTFETEVYRYVIHGLLHLIGYDDQTDEERETIRRLEDRYLEDLL